jgi:predicted permease
MLAKFVARLKAVTARERVERELDEEVQFHVEMETQANIERGMTALEARRIALCDIGGITQTKEAVRDQRATSLEAVWLDVKRASRGLRRTPTVSTMVMLTVAVAVAATTTLFALVNGILLRPLALPEAQRLVRLHESSSDAILPAFSVADFEAVRERSQSYDGLFATSLEQFVLTGGDAPEEVNAARVTEDAFSVLGVQPALGRRFNGDEFYPSARAALRSAPTDALDGGPVLLSHSIWQRRFAGDPAIVGKTIRLNDSTLQVIGVLPRDTGIKDVPALGIADCWIPARYREEERHNSWFLFVFGRLRRDTTLQQAKAEIETIGARLAQERGLGRKQPRPAGLVEVQEVVTRHARPQLLLLSGAVILVLLIGCANVGNLLIARTSQRSPELATMIALGASRVRLARLLVAESLLLSLTAVPVGLVLAWGSIRALLSVARPLLPRLDAVAVDARVLLFSVAASVAVGLAASATALWRLREIDLHESLKGRSGATAGRRASRLTAALVAAEVALTLVLLVATGLLVRTAMALRGLNLGFDAASTIVIDVPALQQRSADLRGDLALADRLADRLASVPGVEAAAVGSNPLFVGTSVSLDIIRGGSRLRVQWLMDAVGADFFRATGIRILRGRSFFGTDVRGASRVAILNARAAATAWPGEEPLGKVLVDGESEIVVVGVAADARRNGLENSPEPLIYVPSAQAWSVSPGSIVVRSAQALGSLLPAFRRAFVEVQPGQPVGATVTVDQSVQAAAAARRLDLYLFGAFSSLALLLAMVGITGVVWYATSRRRTEVAIRAALGASPRAVVSLLARRTVYAVVVGQVLGLATALGLNRLMATRVFGVQTTDVPTYAAILVGWGLAALAAGVFPAWLAARSGPANALRCE